MSLQGFRNITPIQWSVLNTIVVGPRGSVDLSSDVREMKLSKQCNISLPRSGQETVDTPDRWQSKTIITTNVDQKSV